MLRSIQNLNNLVWFELVQSKKKFRFWFSLSTISSGYIILLISIILYTYMNAGVQRMHLKQDSKNHWRQAIIFYLLIFVIII